MKVVGVETVRLDGHPELLWVLVESDEGYVGTGETVPRPGAVEKVVHDVLAPMLVGQEVAPEPFWDAAFHAIAYHGFAGVELRALSMIDVALWDLLGQAAGLPVHRMLGGPCRKRVPVYNTCVSYGALNDRERFLDDPGALADELASSGYTAMKIWPFDELSTATLGQRVSREGLRKASSTFARIREAVGDRIELALEGHGCWNLPSAIAIARELDQYRPMWLEDVLDSRSPSAWVELRRATSTPICGSERLFTRYAIAPYLSQGAVDIVNQDLCWTGGFTEFMKVAALAGVYELPVAPHNCHGPIGAMATLHASAAIPNLYLMESVRSFAVGFFSKIAEGAPLPANGEIDVPERPGLGVHLRPDVLERARRVRTDAARHAGWTSGDPWAGGVGDRV